MSSGAGCPPRPWLTFSRLVSSVGEHTSVNHAWIFSALESATRGVVQLLLEDGLVDEAKEVSSSETANRLWETKRLTGFGSPLKIVNKWMARWISV